MFKIIYIGGTKGAFLSYLLSYFSNRIRHTDANPFNPEDGTVHLWGYNNGGLPAYHENFIIENKNVSNINCVIPTLNSWLHFLYFMLASKIRAGNINANPDYLWQKSKSDCGEIEGLKEDVWNLQHKHYIGHKKDRFTKQEIRNWYKQHFDDKLENFSLYKQHKNFENNPWFIKQNCYFFDFEAFFDWSIFQHEVKKIDKKFLLGIDFERSQDMFELYKESIKNDYIVQQVIDIKKIIKKLERREQSLIPKMNVVCEAFLLSTFEKIYRSKLDIGDEFYTKTKEIF